MTSTGLDQRTLGALVANARAAKTEYDDALAWLEVAVKGPMEPVAAEVWAFDASRGLTDQDFAALEAWLRELP